MELLRWRLFHNGTLQKTNISIEGHEREVAGAVIINDAGYLVGERAKAENVGNGMVVDVVNDVEMGVAIR